MLGQWCYQKDRKGSCSRGAESHGLVDCTFPASAPEGVKTRRLQRTRASWGVHAKSRRDKRLVGSWFGLLSFRPDSQFSFSSSITSVIPLQIEVHIPLHRRAQALHAFALLFFTASRFAFFDLQQLINTLFLDNQPDSTRSLCFVVLSPQARDYDDCAPRLTPPVWIIHSISRPQQRSKPASRASFRLARTVTPTRQTDLDPGHPSHNQTIPGPKQLNTPHLHVFPPT